MHGIGITGNSGVGIDYQDGVGQDQWCPDPEEERSHLPREAVFDELYDVFCRYLNSAWGIFHRPTLDEMVLRFKTGRGVLRADAYVVYSESRVGGDGSGGDVERAREGENEV